MNANIANHAKPRAIVIGDRVLTSNSSYFKLIRKDVKNDERSDSDSTDEDAIIQSQYNKKFNNKEVNQSEEDWFNIH